MIIYSSYSWWPRWRQVFTKSNEEVPVSSPNFKDCLTTHDVISKPTIWLSFWFDRTLKVFNGSKSHYQNCAEHACFRNHLHENYDGHVVPSSHLKYLSKNTALARTRFSHTRSTHRVDGGADEDGRRDPITTIFQASTTSICIYVQVSSQLASYATHQYWAAWKALQTDWQSDPFQAPAETMA